MLQNIGTEFANKLPILVVDLNLVCGRSFRHDYVTRRAHNRHPIRIEQLPVSLAALAKLKLEAALFVEDLDAVVISVRNDDIILCIDGHATRLRELALHHAELPKLAVVDHLLSLDLGFGGKDRRGHEFGSEIHHGIGGGGRQGVWVGRSVLENTVGSAVGPFFVRVDAVEVQVADGGGERAQAVGTAESF